MLHRILAGDDGPGRSALPAGEILHPVPLAAAALLCANDWLLKGAGWAPPAVTGKLSDLAGLVFVPLLVTALVDVALFALARLGVAVDFSLGPRRLAAAIVATGAVFSAAKLSPEIAGATARVLHLAFPSPRIVADPTDLFALPALAIAGWLGRREIARVPLGRVEVVVRDRRKGGTPIAPRLADVAACGGSSEAVRALASALEDFANGDVGAAARANEALAALRRRPSRSTGESSTL